MVTGGEKSRVPKCATGSWLLEGSIPVDTLLTAPEPPPNSKIWRLLLLGSSAKVKERSSRCSVKVHMEQNQQLITLV